MSISADKTTHTPEDLLALPDDGKTYELVGGQVVEKKMGFRSSRIGGRVFASILAHVDANALGWVNGPDAGYQCFPDEPTKVRKPDVSFIAASRMSAEDEPEGHCRIVPDLAVEVVSPNDLFEEVSIKVSEYLAAGVQLVWVLDPATQRVSVYRQNGPDTILNSRDELVGDDVLPGFRCQVADLFATPSGMSAG